MLKNPHFQLIWISSTDILICTVSQPINVYEKRPSFLTIFHLICIANFVLIWMDTNGLFVQVILTKNYNLKFGFNSCLSGMNSYLVLKLNLDFFYRHTYNYDGYSAQIFTMQYVVYINFVYQIMIPPFSI